MNAIRFEVTIVRGEAIPCDVVRERAYSAVRVSANWPEDLAAQQIHMTIDVSGDVDRLDATGYVELFFYDAFLLLNLAAPGSFGGTIAIAGGELPARALALSPRVFESAGVPKRLPLPDVEAWYDGLAIGTQQLATSGVAEALFLLLHLSRGEEDEEISVLRVAKAAEALVGRPEALRRLFELRESVAKGRTPVYHPMHDDSLDPRVEDATSEWILVADDAARVVIRALQERVTKKNGGRAWKALLLDGGE